MKALGLAILSLILLPAAVLAGRGDDLVHVSVLANVSAVKPGGTFMLGVMLKIDPGWHVYWKSPGDSGLATKVTFDLPSGFAAGDVQYPIPMRQTMAGDIVNNIYENQVMLLTPITVGKDVPIGRSVTIMAHVKWLVCQDVCVPGSGESSMAISTGSDGEPANGELFGRWTAQIPAADASGLISISTAKISGSGPTRHVDVSFNWKSDVSKIEWFPADVGQAMLKNVKLQTAGNVTTISFDIEAPAVASLPGKLDSVLAFVDSGGVRRGVEFPLSVDWENIAAVGR